MPIVTIINVLVGPKGINFGLQFVLGGFNFSQSKHSLTNFFTSLLRLVQKNRDLIFSLVLSVPKCPAVSLQCSSCIVKLIPVFGMTYRCLLFPNSSSSTKKMRSFYILKPGRYLSSFFCVEDLSSLFLVYHRLHFFGE